VFIINLTYVVTFVIAVTVPTLYGLDGQRFEPRLGQNLPDPSIPAPRPTQPPVQWVLGPGRGADHPLPSNAEVEYRWSYTSVAPLFLLGM
jgi:hypothetical protein